MPTTPTALLGLALPVQGELDGQWGNVVNNQTTSYLDIAIAGTQTLSTDADANLVQTLGTNAATNIGATTAQYAVIRWTASNGATTRNINVPNLSKTYVVINDGTGSIVLRGTTGPTAGITIVSGEKCVAAWNGSDFVKVSSSVADGVTTFQTSLSGLTPASGTAGAVTLAGTLGAGSGGTGLITTTPYSVVFSGTTATGNFQATAGPGTATHVLTSNGAGALPTFQANSGITTGKSIAMAMIFGF